MLLLSNGQKKNVLNIVWLIGYFTGLVYGKTKFISTTGDHFDLNNFRELSNYRLFTRQSESLRITDVLCRIDLRITDVLCRIDFQS